MENINCAQNSFLISLEGIEGSGKSTQIVKIKDYLVERGFIVTILREPGGTEFGELLRQAILESKTTLHPLAEAHLFASSRAQLLHEKIIPSLSNNNNIVIIDRFLESSIAYQGFARALGHQKILEIHNTPPLNTRAHLCLYLRIDLQTSLERQNNRGQNKDYFEKSKKDFYKKLILGYDYCAANFDHVKTINALESQSLVFESIKKEINKILC